MHNLIKSITHVLETQGMGNSVWRHKDCVTFIQEAIRANGVEPAFSLPAGFEDVVSELQAIKLTIEKFGSMREGWLDAIKREPALKEWDGLPSTGMICMSAKDYVINNEKGDHGPVLAVYGADLLPWARTQTGIGVVHPIEKVWNVVIPRK